jgi:hypothetical protein
MDFYTFDTEEKANECLNFINNSEWFPITPKEGKTGTEKWAQSITRFIDGRYGVLRIPEARLLTINVPKTNSDYFLLLYGQNIQSKQGSDIIIEE